MLTPSGNLIPLPLVSSVVHDFTHSLYIHYIIYIRTKLQFNDSGLFAWISLTALFRTYFIKHVVLNMLATK